MVISFRHELKNLITGKIFINTFFFPANLVGGGGVPGEAGILNIAVSNISHSYYQHK